MARTKKDNWENRSKNMICSTCVFFVLKSPSKIFGRCRRRSPTLSGWPGMFITDWCGDHRLNENKIDD